MKVDWKKYRDDVLPAGQLLCHLNNAGASLAPASTVQSVIDHLLLENRIGGYEAAAQKRDAASRVYQLIGEMINCDPSEVAYVDSASRAWNTIVYSLKWQPGDRILTSQTEFGSNVVTLQHICELYGTELTVLSPGNDGEIDVGELERNLTKNVRLVAITHVPMHTSAVQPIGRIGEMLKGRGIFFLVDACQSVGQMKVDARAIQCDALTATGRKWLRGPRGTGFLYVRRSSIDALNSISLDLSNADWLERQSSGGSHLKLRQDARLFELWERSIANFLGLGEAVKYALGIGVDNIESRVVELGKALREMLSKERGLAMADYDQSRTGIVSVSAPAADHDKLKTALNEKGVNISVCHDWDAPWDLSARRLVSVLRLSPHYYNSVDDLERACKAFREVLGT